ncbi:myb family transcription factor PHL11 [Jatropha curcas]|uniref:myb family transcription factor PHL11 n=1 Tax=Jatropha curcas TaxID=180498 RepID=UPI0018938B49|nr:myb family transcription factor PHL11 [Jatropha curcas]
MSYVNFGNNSSGLATASSPVNDQPREVAETSKSQIEVHDRLSQQLEVQKKLRMRIEVQEKYLQAILDKAQKSLSLDIKSSDNPDLALSNLIQNINAENKKEDNVNDFTNFYSKATSSSLHIKREEIKYSNHKAEGLTYLDLNTMDNCDFVAVNTSELLKLNMLSYSS